MIYNREKYKNTVALHYFREWKRRGLIGRETPFSLTDTYSEQNAWLKLFSFILTLIAGSAAFAFLLMLTDFDIPSIPVAISGVGAILYCNSKIRLKNGFKTGDIEASLLISGSAAISFVPVLLDKDPGFLYWGISGIIVFGLLSVYYLSTLSFIISFAFLCYLIFTVTEKYLSAALLPFAMMFVFGTLYLNTVSLFKTTEILYKSFILYFRILSLIILILAGNYFVVRSLSESLLGSKGEINFAWFFYLYSTAFPINICWHGLKHHRRPEVICGIAGLIAGVVGIREYHSILPLEYALSIAGAVFLAIGYLAVIALKKPLYGLSIESDGNESSFSKVNNLVIGFVIKQDEKQRPALNELDSGGSFGGGGAGSKY